MNTMRMLLALAVAAPLAAQQPDSAKAHRTPMGPGMMMHHEMGGMRTEGMGESMMGVMMFAPDHLLTMGKERLALTDQQVARLTALRDAAKTAQDAAMAEAKTHMDALQQAFQANAPDTAALRQHFLAAHTAMGNAHFAQLRAAAQAKAALTDIQRSRVQGWMDAMQQMGTMMRRERQEGPEHGEHRPNR
jgi:Spy/CpxP family protein refolding chaperone